VELIWLTGRLMPDFKTIADFRKDNGAGRERGDGQADGRPFVAWRTPSPDPGAPERRSVMPHAPASLPAGDQSSTSMTVFASRAAASALRFEPGMPDETNAAR
jgi:hypothetical protein